MEIKVAASECQAESDDEESLNAKYAKGASGVQRAEITSHECFLYWEGWGVSSGVFGLMVL